MPPVVHGLCQWPPPLASRLAGHADAPLIAAAVGAVWRDIDAALSPVIGHRGVAALLQRSVKLTLASHPWLAEVPPGSLAAIEPSALTDVMARQSTSEAANAGCALFEHFRALLDSLVGEALTDRLLHAVWATTKGQAPAQDNLP